MWACGEREEGTWVNGEMVRAYEDLAREGHALAYEVREEGVLVGGLYGVLLGGLFAAESKFHRRTDASKLALLAAVHHLFASGIQLFDVQFQTQHLATLGVFEVSRSEYLARVRVESARPDVELLHGPEVDLTPWLRSISAGS
jgi:leucyl/phenylalanyl-tRNA--protein transferase